MVVPGTGISLQNRGLGFVTTPGHPEPRRPAQAPVPHHHPRLPHARRRGPEMSFGVMGGPMQAQGHLQMVLRSILWDQDPQAAADAPRWRFVAGRTVAIESTIGAATLEALGAMGHAIEVEAPDASFGFGGAQLIRRIPGGYAAGSDPRKDGCAVGY